MTIDRTLYRSHLFLFVQNDAFLFLCYVARKMTSQIKTPDVVRRDKEGGQRGVKHFLGAEKNEVYLSFDMPIVLDKMKT